MFTVRDSQQPRCSELLLAVMVAAGGERCRQTRVRDLQEEPETSLRNESNHVTPGSHPDQSFDQRVMSASFRYLRQIRGVSTWGQKLCNSAQQ